MARATVNILRRRSSSCVQHYTLSYKSSLQPTPREISYGIPEGQLTELVPLNLVGLQNFIQTLKPIWFPWHTQVSKHTFDTGVRNIVKAYQNFFAGRSKYPKYKKKPKHDVTADLSVSMTDINAKWFTPNGSHINLPIAKGLWRTKTKTGTIINLEGMRTAKRDVVGKVKIASGDKRAKRTAKLIYTNRASVQEITYSYSGGYWWVAVRLRVRKENLVKKQRKNKNYIGGTLGIDAAFGDDFAVCSQPIPELTDITGRIKAPKILRSMHVKLTKAQQDHARTTPGSKRNMTTLKQMQKLYGKVAEERKRWLNVLANELVGRFDKIVVENLNLKALAKHKRDKNGRKVFSFGASVGDNSWGMFVTMLEEKAKLFKVIFVKASRWFPSSKKCSDCGVVKAKLLLSVRMFVCEHCGLVLDRDVNAAMNLKQYTPTVGKKTTTTTITTRTGSDGKQVSNIAVPVQDLNSNEKSIEKTSWDSGQHSSIPTFACDAEGRCTVRSRVTTGSGELTYPSVSKQNCDQ